MLLDHLRNMGVKSEYAYTAGFCSIGLSFVSWAVSRINPNHDRAQSDRWGIFVGHWAPTLFAIGIALRLEEKKTA